MNELAIILRPDDAEPMYTQIYNFIRDNIRNGKLACGSRLPSTRSLAIHLDISRSTVQMAYDQLFSEGYVETIPCRGYFISHIDGLYNLCTTSHNPSQLNDVHVSKSDSFNPVSFKSKDNNYITEDLYNNSSLNNKHNGETGKFRYDFSPGGIDLANFPFNAWRKISRNILTHDNKELFNIGEPQGEYEFRQTISEYLYQARGVSCRPEQIIVGAGNEYLLMLLNQLIEDSAAIAMENPTYNQAFKTFQSLGRRICPIGIDKNGIKIDDLNTSEASVVYVMPSHQYPMGIIMPIKRRAELMHWANADQGRYIIEDDHDSEFRYHGRPIPALHGLDTANRVIYLGTFSKSIAPAIRMSYMVLPQPLLEIYQQKCSFFSSTVSRIDQTIVNSYINEGYYERHLNKMRAAYKVRHDLLMNELKAFDERFKITGENAGIHVLLTARYKTTEKELIQSALEAGVRVYALSDSFISETATSEYGATIIIGYSSISNEDITEGMRLLKKAWSV